MYCILLIQVHMIFRYTVPELKKTESHYSLVPTPTMIHKSGMELNDYICVHNHNIFCTAKVDMLSST